MFRRSISLLISIAFSISNLSFTSMAHAQSLLGLPEPGTMVSLSQAYSPVILKGLAIHKENPFLFDFIVDAGQDKMQGEQLKAEGDKLVKYFLATVAIPEKDLWVNLSPYEKDRTVPEALGQTDMGRDLLAQDYLLKQITASLIYPEKELGKKFWDNVYQKTQAKYGNINIPVNTFNKVWIMSDKAEIFERGQTAFVTKSHLKVMLEEDYLATQKNQLPTRGHDPDPAGDGFVSPGTLPSELPMNAKAPQGNNQTHNLSSQIIREVILPELEKEINTGRNFAPLRQIFNSIILASWYKTNLKQTLLNQVYADKEKVKGIDIADKTVKEQIYQRYLQAYKKGVFNYIKEDDASQGTSTPRKYFSGGVNTHVHLDMASVAAVAEEITSAPQSLFRLVVDTRIDQDDAEKDLYVKYRNDPGYQASASEILPAITALQQDLVVSNITQGAKGFQIIRLRNLEVYAKASGNGGHFIRNDLRRYLTGPQGNLPIKTMGMQDFDFGWSENLNADEILQKAQEWLRVLRIVALEGIEKNLENLRVKEGFILSKIETKGSSEFYEKQLAVTRSQIASLSDQIKNNGDAAMGALNRSKVGPFNAESYMREQILNARVLSLVRELKHMTMSPGQITGFVQYLEVLKNKFGPEEFYSSRNIWGDIRVTYVAVGLGKNTSLDAQQKKALEDIITELKPRVFEDSPLEDRLFVDRSEQLNRLLLRFSGDVHFPFTQQRIETYRNNVVLYLSSMIHQLNTESEPNDPADVVRGPVEALPLDNSNPASVGTLSFQEVLAKRFARTLLPADQITTELLDYLERFQLKFDLAATIERKSVDGVVYFYVKVDDYPASMPSLQNIFEKAVLELLKQTIQDATFERGANQIKIRVLYGDRNPELYPGDAKRTQDLLALLKKDTFIYMGGMIKELKKMRAEANSAMSAPAFVKLDQDKAVNGGIDLKNSGANTTVSKEGAGVQFTVDPAMIARVKREGISSLTPVILRIEPIINIWTILGLAHPKGSVDRLAGV